MLVTFEARNTLNNDKLRAEGMLPVSLKDFDIQTPALLGIKINQEIRVQFQFAFDTNQ